MSKCFASTIAPQKTIRLTIRTASFWHSHKLLENVSRSPNSQAKTARVNSSRYRYYRKRGPKSGEMLEFAERNGAVKERDGKV